MARSLHEQYCEMIDATGAPSATMTKKLLNDVADATRASVLVEIAEALTAKAKELTEKVRSRQP